MIKALAPVKNFVSKHRVAVAVVATSSVFVALNLRNAKLLNEFLTEHNLVEEYYSE
jgi:hypothetical protein